MMMKIDELIGRIGQMQNPTVLGLDTRHEYFPEGYMEKTLGGRPRNLGDIAACVIAYNRALIDALSDIVPCVKLQAAYYEMLGVAGMGALEASMRYARAKGMLVMCDGKRNDIAATGEAYAAAYLGETAYPGGAARAFPADFLTVNGYLGSDGVKPFVTECARGGNGIFVLVKTSNPSSGELQDRLIDGKPLYEHMGEAVAEWGKDLMGENGYSAVGAVVGATYGAQGARLRKLLPHVFFLVPGYGAQGATAEDLAGCFDASGGGAIVNASRSILCAHKKFPGKPFDDAARDEALDMRAALRDAVSL